jgi:hypothetical protein
LFAVNAIAAPVTGGTVSNLANEATASHLAAHDALLYTASNGIEYLVVDANGVAGYQAGADLLIRLDTPVHLDALSTGTFTLS